MVGGRSAELVSILSDEVRDRATGFYPVAVPLLLMAGQFRQRLI
jgi:hypothetical protein